MRAALLSFRLGGTDGVSIVAASWSRLLHDLGWSVRTVAGAGSADWLLPGLAWPVIALPPRANELVAALDGIDVVVVENLCSLPLNPAATEVVVDVLRGRAAVLHHHDLPWQRREFAGLTDWPPDDPAWRHVTVNELSQRDLKERGIEAVTIYNGFDAAAVAGPGDRERVRGELEVGDALVVLHPVRAIERKDIPAALHLAEGLDATYWLTGPAEEGYGPTLDALFDAARCPIRHQPVPGPLAAGYAAADAVAFPSKWEGFGNPLVESALHRRPLAVRRYPVAEELARLGFRWFAVDDLQPLRSFLADPDEAILDHNRAIAVEHFSLEVIRDRLADVLSTVSP